MDCTVVRTLPPTLTYLRDALLFVSPFAFANLCCAIRKKYSMLCSIFRHHKKGFATAAAAAAAKLN